MHPFRYLNLRDLGRLSPRRQDAVLALYATYIISRVTAPAVALAWILNGF